MASRISVFVVALVLFSGCDKKEATGPVQPSPSFTADEYIVLAALMDSLVTPDSVPLMVVEDSTSGGTFSNTADSALARLLRDVGQQLTQLKSETSANFVAKNLTRSYVDAPKSIHPAFVRRSETSQEFPSCQVSRVGLSSDGQQALVYAGFAWATLAGHGSFYLLSRVQGGWIISDSIMIWIS